jgi:AraC-like DNA-binding protein
VMRELGTDPEAIFEGSGYTIAQFEDPDSELPYATGSRFLARCAKATKCPHFGLLVGMRAHPSSLGIAGFLLLNCPDVGTALGSLVQNLDLHDQGGVPTLLIQGDSTELGYAIHQTNVEVTEHIYDASIAFACNTMRDLCGSNWNPTDVLLSRRSPPDTKPYRQFYRAPPRFNADRNAIVFPSRWLNHRIPGADALLHRFLEREANELHLQRKANIISDTRRLLRTSLMTGNCTINGIARQLCMHERTLHRRLREEGTSFQHELDAVRHDFARQLLAGSAMPIARIAATLNYAGVGSFNRAFKRWTGLTPARWRYKNTPSS